jgi:hypothetical protein
VRWRGQPQYLVMREVGLDTQVQHASAPNLVSSDEGHGYIKPGTVGTEFTTLHADHERGDEPRP